MRVALPRAALVAALSIPALAAPAGAGVLVLGSAESAPSRPSHAKSSRRAGPPATFQGAKVGFAFLGAPAVSVSYALSQELGANISLLSEVSLLNTGLFSGRIAEVGLGWAPPLAGAWLRAPLSVRGGYATISGLDGDVPTFGGGATAGLEATFGPLRGTCELGWQSYLPLRQVGGAANGSLIQPYGLFGRAGVAFGF